MQICSSFGFGRFFVFFFSFCDCSLFSSAHSNATTHCWEVYSAFASPFIAPSFSSHCPSCCCCCLCCCKAVVTPLRRPLLWLIRPRCCCSSSRDLLPYYTFSTITSNNSNSNSNNSRCRSPLLCSRQLFPLLLLLLKCALYKNLFECSSKRNSEHRCNRHSKCSHHSSNNNKRHGVITDSSNKHRSSLLVRRTFSRICSAAIAVRTPLPPPAKCR